MNALFDLSGKKVLVVGGGGLGARQAAGLASFGADIAVADLQVDRADQIRDEVESFGRSFHSYAIDITREDAVMALVESVQVDLGGIDILLNSAGMTKRGPSEFYEEALWDSILAVNLTGTLLVTHAVSAVMIRQKAGNIINMGSIFSGVGLPESPAYCMSKGAVASLTRTLAVEWAPHGIRVNAILPCWFDTQMGRVVADREKFYQGREDAPSVETLQRQTVGRIPLARLGRPEEIVGATVFLASGASSMVTGHLLAVDGGFLAR